MKATILRAGFLTTVQDLGRIGSREFGVSVGGALDQQALRVANLLVGNDEGAAGFEITLGGARIRFEDNRAIAWGGGDFEVVAASVSVPPAHVATVEAGREISLHQAKAGCRCWLAVSGGLDVPVVLQSRSTDLRAQFGGWEGRALRDGDVIPLGAISSGGVKTSDPVSSWSAPLEWTKTARPSYALRFVRGADWDRFNDSTVQRFTSETFTVSADSDRMGARLEGPPLPPKEIGDLVSEAVAPGTIQVPPGGQPIVLLGDCQTIGGYPKIAHVITVDLPLAAQLRANDQVRLREVALAEAHRLLFARAKDLQCFKMGLSLRPS